MKLVIKLESTKKELELTNKINEALNVPRVKYVPGKTAIVGKWGTLKHSDKVSVNGNNITKINLVLEEEMVLEYGEELIKLYIAILPLAKVAIAAYKKYVKGVTRITKKWFN